LRAPAQPRCTSASAPSTRAACTRKRCDTGQHAERRPCAPGRPARPYFAAPHRRSLPQHPRRHACGCLRPRLSRFRLLLLDTKRYRFSRCRAKAAFSGAKGGPAPRAAGAGADAPSKGGGSAYWRHTAGPLSTPRPTSCIIRPCTEPAACVTSPLTARKCMAQTRTLRRISP
jgi:hypothetical protein